MNKLQATKAKLAKKLGLKGEVKAGSLLAAYKKHEAKEKKSGHSKIEKVLAKKGKRSLAFKGLI